MTSPLSPHRPTFEAILALPAALVLGSFVWLAAHEGGFETTTWYPVAILVTATLLVAALTLPAPRLRLRSAPAMAIIAFGLYALWCYASILWADDREAAWHGANLTFLYAVIVTLFASWRLAERVVGWLLVGFVVAIALLGLGTVWHGSTSDTAADAMILADRLSAPTGYPNASASLFALAGWLGLGCAAATSVTRIGRSFALASAGICFGLCVVAQSRGWILTTPVVLVLFLAAYPRRLPALVAAAAVAAALFAASPQLLDVFTADDTARRATVETLAITLTILGVGLAAVGAFLPFLDTLSVPRRARRPLGAVAALALVMTLVVVVATGDPVGRAESGWRQFTQESNATDEGSRFTGLGSNRYDFWRVALNEFSRHPVQGIGSDNFAIPYVAQRRSGEQPLHPHSLWVRTLSQTGVVGAALLVLGIVAAAWVVLRPRRQPLAVALLVSFGAWFLHAQGDWLWETPALGATAFGLLGLAMSVSGAPLDHTPARQWGKIVSVVTAVGLIALVPPWLASRLEANALASWRTTPARSIGDLRRAARLNPLADRPWVLAGAIASRRGDLVAMREHFAAAVDRNPRNWYSRLELAIAAAATGERQLARREIDAAQALNPRDAVLRRVARTIRAGGRPNPAEIDAEYEDRTNAIAG